MFFVLKFLCSVNVPEEGMKMQHPHLTALLDGLKQPGSAPATLEPLGPYEPPEGPVRTTGATAASVAAPAAGSAGFAAQWSPESSRLGASAKCAAQPPRQDGSYWVDIYGQTHFFRTATCLIFLVCFGWAGLVELKKHLVQFYQ